MPTRGGDRPPSPRLDEITDDPGSSSNGQVRGEDPVHAVVAGCVEVLRPDQAGPNGDALRSNVARPHPGDQRQIGNRSQCPPSDRDRGLTREALPPGRGAEAVEKVKDLHAVQFHRLDPAETQRHVGPEASDDPISVSATLPLFVPPPVELLSPFALAQAVRGIVEAGPWVALNLEGRSVA